MDTGRIGMTIYIQGIDISIYQGEVPYAKWAELYSLGQRVACVGSWHGLNGNPYAEGNLERADAAGFSIATYVALNAGDGRRAVTEGQNHCGRMWDKVGWVGVDCEIDGITSRIITDAVNTVLSYGKRPVIYTARWWWKGHFGNSQDFKHLPLWNAFYDQDPDIDFATASYGGWTLDKVMGEQYTGSTELAGITVDKNSFRKDFIEEDKDMAATDEQILALLKILNEAAEYARLGLPLKPETKAALHYLTRP
jgi:GH25 family lysozyme M1 (1,4-beta-N-acetylmuramidase)